ncbi:unnamed protein product [Larinioides sclopetarius]|uniref:Uncharacterized protein n=1 Tax=Larinioides sclopetarius TaxID=280406 RepID=A0AAV1Z8N8_9ARAC
MALLEPESRENRRKRLKTRVVFTTSYLTELPASKDLSKLVVKMSGDNQEPVQEPVGNEVEKANDKQSSEKETRMKTAHKQLLLEAVKRERRLGFQQSYPVIWMGDLFLLNFEVRVEIRLVHGDLAVFKNAEPACTIAYPGIHVSKKLKFDDIPQKYLNRKMQETESEKAEKADKQLCERESSTCTTDKECASKRPEYEMLLFPPSKFVYRNILPVAPTLTERLYKDQIPHLMLVISNAFGCLRCAQLLEESMQDYKTV